VRAVPARTGLGRHLASKAPWATMMMMMMMMMRIPIETAPSGDDDDAR
jgi:hypothetical protein